MTLYQELKEKAVLLLDPDPWTRDSLTMLFQWNSCRLATCDNAEDGHRAIDSEPFDIVICAHGAPGVDGPAFLAHCRDAHPDAVRIALGPFSGAQFAGDSDLCGIHAWLQKPLTIESVESVLGEAVRSFGMKAAKAD